METIYFDRTGELKRTKSELEKKLRISLEIQGHKVIFSGDALDEYIAEIVLDAMNFGFSFKKAILLADENMTFRKINIKDFTRKKNLQVVRARFIGKNGKTKKTIENVANCEIFIKNNDVGVIGSAESIDKTMTAVTNLIKGTKQANTYRYLERVNKNKYVPRYKTK